MDYSKIFLKEAVPTSIGGQAIMEGVMMRGDDRTAIAVRVPNGGIYLKTEKTKAKPKVASVPFARGVYSFFASLVLGMRTLMQSAEILEQFVPEEEIAEPGKVETAITRKFGDRAAWNFLMIGAVIISVVISIACFIIFPTIAVNLLGKWIKNSIVLNLIEGVFRICLFVLYILLIRNMEDIKTLFRYHGAEHKTIHCFENGLDLTPANAREFYTLHPRCGTSFLVFVFIISLLLFSLLGWPSVWMRIVSRLLLLPVIAGVSYELLKWAGRSDNAVVRVLSYPGLMMQKLTTAEPTDEQLQVAICSLKAVLVDPETPEVEGFVDDDAHLIEPITLDEMIDDRTYVPRHIPRTKDTIALGKDELSEALRSQSGEGNPYMKETLVVGTEPSDSVESLKATIAERAEDRTADQTLAAGLEAIETSEQAMEEMLSEIDEPVNRNTESLDFDFDAEGEEFDEFKVEPISLVFAAADEKPARRPEGDTIMPWPELEEKRYSADIAMAKNTVKRGQEILKHLPNGEREAVDLFCYVTGWSRSQIVTRGEELLSEADLHAYKDRLQMRLDGTPMQYIVKVQEFMGLPFRVNPSVLIPRLDTEVLVDNVIGLIRGKRWVAAEVLDLCAGSGAIGISIAHEIDDAMVTLTDVSEEAIETAKGNAEINEVSKRCRFYTGNMFEVLSEDELFDVIVSNPPYIKTDEIEKLDIEVKDHEPRLALDGGKDGLDAYRVIARESGKHLRSGGILALEIGYDQADAVALLLEISKNYSSAKVLKDLAGHNRVILAERI